MRSICQPQSVLPSTPANQYPFLRASLVVSFAYSETTRKFRSLGLFVVLPAKCPIAECGLRVRVPITRDQRPSVERSRSASTIVAHAGLAFGLFATSAISLIVSWWDGVPTSGQSCHFAGVKHISSSTQRGKIAVRASTRPVRLCRVWQGPVYYAITGPKSQGSRASQAACGRPLPMQNPVWVVRRALSASRNAEFASCHPGSTRAGESRNPNRAKIARRSGLLSSDTPIAWTLGIGGRRCGFPFVPDARQPTCQPP